MSIDTYDPDLLMLFGIWDLGRTYIYSWIISIAKGIAELEAMGLFHCDIELRNTVKFAGIFKLIDFDYIFKVKLIGTGKAEVNAYENMVGMLT